MWLDPRGGRQFADITRLNIHRELSIFLDGIATSHATIQSQIGERGQITHHQHRGARWEHGHGTAREGKLHSVGQAYSIQSKC